ncbi:MAG TPA: FkbM family methyltransferase [Nocardioidaceae bacterium]|nr:FkbM family methyltransferase [Nocardioidaceae bacterium]
MHRLSYSQFGEDITAQNLLRNVGSGFYVDIGAHHPLRHSNTAMLHMKGWQGVTVEPMLQGFRAFQRFRPHAINVRAAIHNEKDSVTLYKFRGGLANTVMKERAEDMRESKEVVGEEIVPALNLNGVFERHVPEGVRVNYLTVDIEGYDTEAILAFDLDKYRPDVVCIEIHRPDMLALGEHAAVKHLSGHGYQLYAINVFSFTFANIEAAAKELHIPRVARLHEVTERAAHAP